MKNNVVILGIVLYFLSLIVFAQEVESPKRRLAIANFEVRGDAPKEIGSSIADLLASEMKETAFELVERMQVKKLIEERLLAMPTTATAEEIQKISENLEANFVLLGAIEKIEGAWLAHYRLVEVKSGKIQDYCKQVIRDAKDYQDLSRKLCNRLQADLTGYLSLVGVARNLALDIVKDLVENQPSNATWNVVVFPFGNQDDEAPATFGNIPLIMQNELIQAILSEMPESANYRVMTMSQIQRKFKNQSPEGISRKDIATAQEILNEQKIEVGIVGHFGLKNFNRYSIGKWTGMDVSMILAKKNKVLEYNGSVYSEELRRLGNIARSKENKGRFGVEVWVKLDEKLPDLDEQAWKKLDLYRCKRTTETQADGTIKASSWYNTLLLSIPPSYCNKRYKIRIVNHGSPSLQEHPLDNDRLFAVAVLVDGVNSIYQKQGNSQFEPVVCHPNKAFKWVLTPPGKRLVPNANGMVRSVPNHPDITTTIEGAKLVEISALEKEVKTGKNKIQTVIKAQNQVDVLGFQSSLETSKVFQFARPEDSAAELVGIVNQVGLMSVYFYPEKLPAIGTKSTSGSMAGTKAGPEISNKVNLLNFQRENEPAEAIHIVYRYSDQLPCKPEELELVFQ